MCASLSFLCCANISTRSACARACVHARIACAQQTRDYFGRLPVDENLMQERPYDYKHVPQSPHIPLRPLIHLSQSRKRRQPGQSGCESGDSPNKHSQWRSGEGCNWSNHFGYGSRSSRNCKATVFALKRNWVPARHASAVALSVERVLRAKKQ